MNACGKKIVSKKTNMIHIVEGTTCSNLVGEGRFSEALFDIKADLHSAAVACPHSCIQSVGLVAGDLWPVWSICHSLKTYTGCTGGVGH